MGKQGVGNEKIEASIGRMVGDDGEREREKEKERMVPRQYMSDP
jgi:hypothetical protein